MKPVALVGVHTRHFLVEAQEHNGREDVLVQQLDRVVEDGNQDLQGPAVVGVAPRVVHALERAPVAGREGEDGKGQQRRPEGPLRHLDGEVARRVAYVDLDIKYTRTVSGLQFSFHA